MRLADKVALIFGAGQAPGIGMGNGRATALVFAREGATVVAVDRDLNSAQETVDLVRADGGEAVAVQADVRDEASIRARSRGVSRAGDGSTCCTTTWG